ncbi:MAG: DUF5723 family protein [Sediminicola sp.]|tara:strand:+ start:100038 stop:101471 length:1434 start_codon:yes stop_codon:yes gene_type:complete
MKLPTLLMAALLGGCILTHSQNKQLLYDFNEIPQSLMVNPGVETSFQWYAGIPFLSGISLQAASSGISVHDIFADDGIDINVKIREKAIYGMDTRDELSGTYQVELLSGGYRSKDRPNDFYSFGIYHEGDAIGYWFQDLAILGFEGNAGQLERRFDLGDLKTRGEIVNVFHFGINRKMDNRLTLGARAKLYSGIIDFNTTRNKGYFVTTQGQNNIFANTIVSDMRLRTSGIDGLLEDDAEIGNIISKRAFLGGDLGLGADLGFTYKFTERAVLTASLLDVGFIYHAGDIKNYTLNGTATVEGVEVILPDALADPDRDFWQELVDEIEALLPFEEDNRSYVTFRPTKLYSSFKYSFGEKRSGADCDCDPMAMATGSRGSASSYTSSVGAQLYMINRPRGPQSALSAFYQHRFGNFLSLKGTYTIDKFSLSNIGMGLSMQVGKVNLYAMADNLLAYRNFYDSRYASFQFGINILSWGGK